MRLNKELNEEGGMELFNGRNYTSWAPMMAAELMKKKLWKYVIEDAVSMHVSMGLFSRQ